MDAEQYFTSFGFQLGLHVAEIVLKGDPDSKFDAMIDCLDGIARGEITPFESGAELRRRFPDIQDVEQARQQNQQAIQRAAGVVLDSFLKQGPS